ncbi:Patatin-like protein 2 [Camellia lanceoleosa]|uniref:Patatin-like protein 2 n=1 Tax=Camellia lanceoleosa TaxID=1840588 RepID=A0ACC0I6G5_9ERIC|nr:Patatin-like protein 2 [Camellia lanceoleosa]
MADDLFSKRQVTILSIDGGGIRGVIPLKVLQFLEDELEILENGNKQKQEGEASNKKVRLADYFDVIAGTSAGALITSLLASPSPRTAEEIIDLFCKEGPKIFSNPGDTIEENSEQHNTTPTSMLGKAANWYYKKTKKTVTKTVKELLAGRPKVIIDNWMEPYTAIFKPVYTGERLNEVAEEVLGKDTLLKDLSTNIVIPTFDVKKDSPVVFTTRLTMLAIREASKLFPEAGDYSNYLILSLGTGKEKLSGGRPLLTGAGIFDWFCGLESIKNLNLKIPPLVDMLFRVSEDITVMMTSYTLGERNLRNYLRIQDYELKPEHAEIDNVNRKNINDLKRIGRDLISRYVAIPNSETGLPNVIFKEDEKNHSPNNLPPKNQDELKCFAKRLYDERRRRMPYN